MYIYIYIYNHQHRSQGLLFWGPRISRWHSVAAWGVFALSILIDNRTCQGAKKQSLPETPQGLGRPAIKTHRSRLFAVWGSHEAGIQKNIKEKGGLVFDWCFLGGRVISSREVLGSLSQEVSSDVWSKKTLPSFKNTQQTRISLHNASKKTTKNSWMVIFPSFFVDPLFW